MGARGRNARNRREMAKDLSKATKHLYERMSNMQKRNQANAKALGKATSAAKMASANALKRAKAQFASKISMLTNVMAAKADRQLIREQRSAMEADLNKSIVRAIAIGEA